MKAKKKTFGIFIYSMSTNSLLVCKSSGNYGGWSIPKGMGEEWESPEESAIRELWEETGLKKRDLVISHIVEMDPIEYKSRKKILHPFLYLIENDISAFKFHCVSLADGKYPEISDYKLVNLDVARKILHESQSSKIDEIKQLILNIC